MTTRSEVTEKERARQMLRSMKTGDHVRATIRSTRQGQSGVVIDRAPFSSDGLRRVKVRWEDGAEVAVLPASIEPA